MGLRVADDGADVDDVGEDPVTLTEFTTGRGWSSAGAGHGAGTSGRRPITLTDTRVPMPRRIVMVSADPQVQAVVDELNKLLALPPNWDSYDADPVDVDSALATLALLDRLQPLRLPEISATPDGQVELEWAQGDLVLVLVVGGTLERPVAKVLFDSGSDFSEWSTSAADDDALDSALREVTDAY